MKFRDTNAQQGAELELAPMIDVVFLLLIFFIVTWQFARFERDMDISVPAAESFEDEKERTSAGEVVVNVRNDGSVVLNGNEVTLDALFERLERISAQYPDQAVILRGDSGADFQYVVNVLDKLKAAGIWNVAFATKKDKDG
ncbi:MAG: biopolymer transporter ExbD [Verrucomicrobiota bacterium]